MKKELLKLKKKLKKYNIDGYIVPKNDEFFGEYSNTDNLKKISNFTGSAGIAIILKNINYLFLDGRYTLQGQLEAGKNFKVINYEKLFNCNLFSKLKLGIDPTLFTTNQIKKFFSKKNKIINIKKNLIDDVKRKKFKTKPFYSLNTNAVGESYKSKIKKVSKHLIKNKADFLFITAPENVAWILNIRGNDNPYSPIPNSRLLIDKKKKIYLICEKYKARKLIKEKKINSNNVISVNQLEEKISNFNKKKFIVDNKTCSIFYEEIITHKNRIVNKDDPTYFLKSIKNKTEIENTIQAHILDGAALTKFLYWIKKLNKKKITEFDAQKKLEFFRKKNKRYLFPSFNTIAGTGKNGAIIHYRAKRNSARTIYKNDIFLCDSGGQYKYGTTDVTRTVCFKKPKKNIQNIFTKVLKGHIAVANTNIKKDFTGKK